MTRGIERYEFLLAASVARLRELIGAYVEPLERAADPVAVTTAQWQLDSGETPCAVCGAAHFAMVGVIEPVLSSAATEEGGEN